jgi:hypothetical protein
MIKFYSTDCPNCRILEKRLIEADVSYEKITAMKTVMEMAERHNFSSVPFCEKNGVFMTFRETIEWLDG